ncbi:uncharacterized protein RAG0_04307 [Rhynchosporium agropyri]|uniref:Uncharacterized protein n=1 Tax=Rhynchosporium agropyri TaxID=914238 RepID=A0A1E1K850_9HELO|nr:uncharacterized protein RAG0_04307 [Rhynchosporium agropyri]
MREGVVDLVLAGDAEKDEAAEVQKLQSAGFSRGALYSKILSPLSESSIILYGHNSPGTVAQDFKEGRDKKAPYLSAPDELVTFIVGEHKQRFTIHEEFVCYHSPVLSAAVNGCFMEGTTKTYTLDDIAPKKSDYSPNPSMPTKSRSRSMRQEPATGFIYTMDKIREDYGVLNGAHFKYIYENTQSGNQLRRLITFQCVRYAEDGFFVNNGANFPHELLVDTATLFQQGVSGPIRLEDYVITRD